MWSAVVLDAVVGDVFHLLFRRGDAAVEVLADVELVGRVAVFQRCHIYGSGANSVGLAGLRDLGRQVKEMLDVDELRIEGATRATGAYPGHDPRPIVFR